MRYATRRSGACQERVSREGGTVCFCSVGDNRLESGSSAQ